MNMLYSEYHTSKQVTTNLKNFAVGRVIEVEVRFEVRKDWSSLKGKYTAYIKTFIGSVEIGETTVEHEDFTDLKEVVEEKIVEIVDVLRSLVSEKISSEDVKVGVERELDKEIETFVYDITLYR